MNFRNTLLTLTLICSCWLSAQTDLESRASQRVSCEDAEFFALENIPLYYEKGQSDSIQIVLDFWEAKCGKLSNIQIIQDLVHLERGLFNEEYINEETYNRLIFFANSEIASAHLAPYSTNPINNRYTTEREQYYRYYLNFFSFARKWASNLLEESYDKCGDRYGLLLGYAGESDRFFQWIKNPCESPTTLQKLYTKEVKETFALNDADGGVFIEYWSPRDNLALLGDHPGVGFYYGSLKEKYFLRGSMAFRFLKSANTYLAKDQGEVQETDNFLGGYFMFHSGYQLLKAGPSRHYAIGGVGIDIMDVLSSEGGDEEEGKSIASFNVTVGWGSRFYLNRQKYLAFEAEYNFLNYINKGGTNLQGDAVSFKLIFGWLQNFRKYGRLKQLRQ